MIVLFIVLLVLALGSLPRWPYSRDWGYYPTSGMTLVLLVLLILVLAGRI